jgi:hypothetical protein
MTNEASNEVLEVEARPLGKNLGVAVAETRPDLVWDNEAPGLCLRVHANGEKSLIFVYRRDSRQCFTRIGTTARWSLEEARSWAKQLRSALNRGHDPEQYNREGQEIIAVNIAKLPELLGRRSD